MRLAGGPPDSGTFVVERRALSRLGKLGVLTGVLVVYFVAGKLGLSLALVHANATAVWPPTGIALAATLMLGYWVWPAILLGALLVNATTPGAGLGTAAGIAAGNTLEALLGAYLVHRFAHGQSVFDQPQTTFRFAFLAGMLATAVSASIGTASLVLGGAASAGDFGAIWLTWWLGDAAGAVVVGPLVILWAGNPYPRWSRAQLPEALALIASLLAVGLAVFGGRLPFEQNEPVEFLCLPLVLWGAFRFGRREAASAAAVLSAIAIWGTLRGMGPFAGYSPNESLLLLQGYLGVLAIMGVSIAAVVSDDRRVRDALRRLNEELEARVTQRTEELHAANDELARSNVELERFAHLASHDLREPLRKVAGYTDLLSRRYRGRLDKEADEWIGYAIDGAERMQALIDALLTYSRVGSRARELLPTDCGAMLKTVLSDLEAALVQSGGSVSAGSLPVVIADQVQIGQLFLNLVSNALKFQGKATPQVHVSAERRGPDWEFCVRDNGIGIAAEHHERIFAMFERLHTRDKYPGTGIGLAICRKIVERHEGRLWVESKLGGGAAFKFTLRALPERLPAAWAPAL